MQKWGNDIDTSQVTIYCFGCKEEYTGLVTYWKHDCEEPQSGESFR